MAGPTGHGRKTTKFLAISQRTAPNVIAVTDGRGPSQPYLRHQTQQPANRVETLSDMRPELVTLVTDGLVVAAAIAAGGPVILLLAAIFSGIL